MTREGKRLLLLAELFRQEKCGLVIKLADACELAILCLAMPCVLTAYCQLCSRTFCFSYLM